jgi:hypothetical protein
MDFYNFYEDYSPEEELSALPRDYTIETALRYNDIIFHINKSINSERFLEFIEHFVNGIPDKIRITTFGVDGPVSILILLFDGNRIRLTADETRYGKEDYYDYYGNQIVSKIRDAGGRTLEDYSLLTEENKLIPIYSIVSN